MDNKHIFSLLIIILAQHDHTNALCYVEPKPYKIVTNTQLVPDSSNDIVEIPCRSMMQAIFTCMNISDCHGINYFSNRRCQLVANLLAGSLVTTDDSASFACKFQLLSIQ